MGSGISLNKEQIIYIIKREIEWEYKQRELYKCPINEFGFLNYETFDDEELFIKKIQILDRYLKTIE
jgi:hypothetical protein